MRKPLNEPPYEIAKLRAAMAARNLDSFQLAAQAGVARRDVQNLLSATHRGRPLRQRLNDFFGEPIFCLDFLRKKGRPPRPRPPQPFAGPTPAQPAPTAEFASPTAPVSPTPNAATSAEPTRQQTGPAAPQSPTVNRQPPHR
jgi:hypothetical protein